MAKRPSSRRACVRRSPRARPLAEECLLLALALDGREHRVLGLLGDAELEHALRRDLDRFAGRGVAAHAGLAVDENELAEPRDRESVAGVLVRHLRELFQDLVGLLAVDLRPLGQLANRLRLGHRHLYSSLPEKCWIWLGPAHSCTAPAVSSGHAWIGAGGAPRRDRPLL